MISKKIKALILDMDGVLWLDEKPIGDLPRLFKIIEEMSLKVAFATNNSTKTPKQYIERLESHGVFDIQVEQVITSSLALANEFSHLFPAKGDVFVIGENGLKNALQEVGFKVIEEHNNENIIAVVVGIDKQINFSKLKTASLLIGKGIPFFGTNPDKTFPTPEGLIIGTGALLAALVAATGVEPWIAGKPSPKMIELARLRLDVQPDETLVVGDRLETDIASGQADHCKTALVLTGVSTLENLDYWSPKPDYVAESLMVLLNSDE